MSSLRQPSDTAAPIHGGFTETDLDKLLHRICRVADLNTADAELLRGQTNAVIRLPAEALIVKIARAGTNPAQVEQTVRFVRWLMALGFPTAPLHDFDAQPLIVDGHAATLWTDLPQPADPIPTGALAEPLRLLHALPAPPISMPKTDVVGAIHASLNQTQILPAEDIRFLRQKVDQLERDLAGVQYELRPDSVLQGDPHHRNALHGADGLVLCDWDSVSMGHPEWDLVTIEIHCRRFGYSEQEYKDFISSYGWDIRIWDGYEVLRDLRELRMISTNAKKSAYSPEKTAEVVRRIAGLRDRDNALIWSIL